MTHGTTNVTFRNNGSQAASRTVAAGMAKALVEFGVDRGAERSALLQASDVDAGVLAHDDERVSFAQYAALYAAAETLCADPALALHFGESMSSMDLLVCHVGSACETMGAAFEAINRYGRLAVDVETLDDGDPFQVETAPEGMWLVDASIYPNDVSQLTETSFTRLIVGTRQLTDRDFVRAVHLVRAEPTYRSEYERIFRAPVRFQHRRNAMLMDPDWFSLPLTTASRYTAPILEAHANRLLDELTAVLRCRRGVEDILRARLDSGAVDMAFVARHVGVSRQTLYRQLKSEGTTFEQVLDEVRRDLAGGLLRDGVSVSDTAQRLGFSDSSAFSRAFKRWTGHSPRSQT